MDLELFLLFDAAIVRRIDVTLHERRTPGAAEALRSWAESRGHVLQDHDYTIADDHPMISWRGMRVSTLELHVPNTRIAVHRVDRAEAA